jgi:SagB-type dehydrogenase family enzyme
LDPSLRFFRLTELDRATWPAWRDRIAAFEAEGRHEPPRSYPGYPRWPLLRLRPRLWPSLERSLRGRRSTRELDAVLPPRRVLSRLLQFGHGVNAGDGRGPVPSAGGLQALELYLVTFVPSWLPAGLYHYDRAGHFLSQIAAGAGRAAWETRVPALRPVTGGSLLWIVVGDGARVEAKYGGRGARFLLLEAGHLVQNLCLLSATLGLTTVPLGGFFEREVARELLLPETDLVLYTAVCGRPQMP